ncbi:hypothetical protein CWN98_13435 [Vibrio splendidus]|uniref:hypothetical protein n=1 Tax=Vibrio splendidus TaxID=29497 RepID=UPI000D364ED1|nr:hypothetical protein [Vibrio splendidus]PTO86524.1 hypothetical protein CWN98_13435 [Vibrio splendidus]
MSVEQALNCSNNTNIHDYDDGNIRIKISNKPNRSDAHEIFLAMAGYVCAVEEFNRIITQAIDPDSDVKFTFSKVENASVGSALKRVFLKVKDGFEQYIESGSDRDIHDLGLLLEENPVVTEPKEVHSLATRLEDQIVDTFDLQSHRPYVDPVKLAKVLHTISGANECLQEDETVDIIVNSNNVVPINTKFRSQISESQMSVTKIIPYEGPDEVKVIRPCNFGRSRWELKSKLTKDAYKAHFDPQCAFLEQYQNGEIPVITARHTLKIRVTYDKYMTGSSYDIKNAIIKSVTVDTDPKDIEQIEI